MTASDRVLHTRKSCPDQINQPVILARPCHDVTAHFDQRHVRSRVLFRRSRRAVCPGSGRTRQAEHPTSAAGAPNQHRRVRKAAHALGHSPRDRRAPLPNIRRSSRPTLRTDSVPLANDATARARASEPLARTFLSLKCHLWPSRTTRSGRLANQTCLCTRTLLARFLTAAGSSNAVTTSGSCF